MTATSPTRRCPSAAVIAGLALMIVANYAFRRVLEHPELRLYDFLQVFYPAADKAFREGRYEFLRLLLPTRELGGSWTTTDLILTDFVVHRLGPAGTWHLFYAFLMAASFALSWLVFRSAVFSYTFALCMGFGTQLYHTYAVSGGIGAPLLFIYYELVLTTAWFVVRARTSRAVAWRSAALAVSIVLMLMAYEGWLDFLVFSVVTVALLAPPLWKRDRVALVRLVWIGGSLLVLGAVYVVIKVRVGYGQAAGSESDVIFNYHHLSPMIEDFVSNGLTHLYIAATNFLPPSFVSSTALYSLGAAELVAEQHGYHAPFSFLVPMHYVFLWRYAAGALAVVVAYALAKSIRSLWAAPSMANVSLTLFLLLMVVGGPTHDIVKIRPMKTVPVVGYHTMLGVLGAALLIAFGVMSFQKRSASRGRTVALTAMVWGVIVYGALARPAMLSHLAAQGGLGEGLYPDPWRAAELRLGIAITRPGGDEPFVLEQVQPTGFGSQHREPRPSGWFVAFAHPLPPASEWEAVTGRVAPIADARWQVHGDGAPGRFQLVSPRLDVPTRHRVKVRLDVVRVQGRVCVGIYDRTLERWIATPEVLDQEYEFESGSSADVRLAIVNCDVRLSENPDSVFDVGAGSYE